VSGRIEVDTERVVRFIAGLCRMLRGPECEYLGLDRVDIVDGHIEVKLLRSFAGRPRRRRILLRQLERQTQTVDREDDPVVVANGISPPKRPR
jgi:hypothetical protein